ncbi:MAG: ADP-ribosylation factor-like protein [Myxococcota bacterium]
MAQGPTGDPVSLRILYWGASGAGKTTALQVLHEKLSDEKKGELRSVPTRLDPTLTYEQFPIQLGTLAERDIHMMLTAVPGAEEASQTRKQLLDRADGIILICDARQEHHAANLESLRELNDSLAAYGRSMEDVPLAVQYNKRDLVESFDIESLHRTLGLSEAAIFETVATEGTGSLQALTAVAKRAVRSLKADVPEETKSESAPEPATAAELMEAAILAEAEDTQSSELDDLLNETRSNLDRPWAEINRETKATRGARISDDLRIVSVGTAQPSGRRSVAVPIVLGNDDGESVSLSLTISLDPLLEEN